MKYSKITEHLKGDEYGMVYEDRLSPEELSKFTPQSAALSNMVGAIKFYTNRDSDAAEIVLKEYNDEIKKIIPKVLLLP